MDNAKPLFDFESDENNGKSEPFSASDQKIIHRQLFTPVRVMLLGKEYNIQPPSPFMARVIANYREACINKITSERGLAVGIVESVNVLKDIINKPDRKEGEDDVLEIANRLATLHRNMFDLSDLKKKYAMRLVQLILLDATNPKWKDRYDDFPPEDELEAVVETRTLDKYASEIEMAELISIHKQMQEPELEKNFERWGATELLMRSSLGRASGPPSR